jgi:hypothetical protein
MFWKKSWHGFSVVFLRFHPNMTHSFLQKLKLNIMLREATGFKSSGWTHQDNFLLIFARIRQ